MKTKKSLGQNWLKSESAVKEIIKAADLKTRETVLEIGPGQGVLTVALLASGAKVIAIEKDDRLIEFLQEKFAPEIKNKKIILIHGDVLKLDFSRQILLAAAKSTDYKLVANIPYYITGQAIRKFLSEEKTQPSRMVLMLQKEVAKRIIASDKKESLLSNSVKAYGTPKYLKTVPAGAFSPPPKVDSAILLIQNISRQFFQTMPEEKFFAVLKKGFSQKRKKLKNNLSADEKVFAKCQLSENIRAEDLTLADWRCLIKNIK